MKDNVKFEITQVNNGYLVDVRGWKERTESANSYISDSFVTTSLEEAKKIMLEQVDKYIK